MNDLWYVLIHHWDDVCDDYADVKFFPSEKAATDYATEQRDKFRTSYESDNYGIEILSGTSNAAYRKHILKLMSIIPAVMQSLPAKSIKSVRCVCLYE